MGDARRRLLIGLGPAQTNEPGDHATQRECNTHKRSERMLGFQYPKGTAATRLLRAGPTLNQIAYRMGWSLRYNAAGMEHCAAVSPVESAGSLDLAK